MPYSSPSAISPNSIGLSGWSVLGMSTWTGSLTAVKTQAGAFGGYVLYNATAAVVYVQVFNTVFASVTLGTTAPLYVIPIPAGSTEKLEMAVGVLHNTAITVAATTTPTGATLAALSGFFLYK